MPLPKGAIAAKLVAKDYPTNDRQMPERARAMRSFLDAVKADDENAADAALADWRDTVKSMEKKGEGEGEVQTHLKKPIPA